MWSSGGEDNHYIKTTTNNCNYNRFYSSSSSSSSISSTSSFTRSSSSSSSQPHSPFSISSPLPTPRRKTMEDVWKDINLTSLQDNPTRGGYLSKPNNHTALQGMNLQDFLARPFNKDQATIAANSNINRNVNHLFGSSSPPPPPPPPPPASLPNSLNLNSGPDQFHYIDNTPSLDNPIFDAFAACSVISPFSKKRGSESEDNSGDHRHKRMIKNRESAARSRARKQAYTNTLEQQIIQLTEENARLKEKQQELDLVAASASQLLKKCSLNRTSTAPF